MRFNKSTKSLLAEYYPSPEGMASYNKKTKAYTYGKKPKYKAGFYYNELTNIVCLVYPDGKLEKIIVKNDWLEDLIGKGNGWYEGKKSSH